MALKHKIDKKTFDKLPEEMQSNYIDDGDGKNFTLDVDGLEDPAELKRAKDRETAAAKKLRADLKAAQDALAELENNAAGNDVEKIKTAMQKKYDQDIAAANDKITKLTTGLKRRALESTAEQIAKEISTAPKVLLPTLLSSLDADIDDDGEVTVHVMEGGKRTNKAIDAWKKDLVANPDYAAIMIGSKASGGGGAASKNAPSGNGSGAASDRNTSERPANPNAMKPAELAAWTKERREARQQNG